MSEERRGPGRPPMRQEQRPESPRQDLEERTRILMEGLAGMGDTTDKFHFDPKIIPDGWSYEWKEHSVMGRIDPSRQLELKRNGWEAVPRARHPELMPDSSTEMLILREGLQLMERPKEVTEAVRARDARAARFQVDEKNEQIEGKKAIGQLPSKGGRVARGFDTALQANPQAIPD